ncbi:MarP family serine protease [Streptomyces sp. NPDC051940]|uniref:MarP family serine protease n=1 Tax=Streptomyces sp. NPDC051940 TaxID=3155675 RepID=UPI00342A6421
MNVLDIFLLAAAVWFAVVGYRQGFVVGILSVVGFIGGGLLAIYLLPVIWNGATDDAPVGPTATVVAVMLVIVCASVGQAFTTHLGNQLRRHITWSPARSLDAGGGALVNVVAMLLVAWLIGSALGTSTQWLGKQVRSSQVLGGVAEVMPQSADTWFSEFSNVLARNGFPSVFSPFSSEHITDVPAPDPALVGSPVVARAKQSIVKVIGSAPSCGKTLEGTGFVFAPQRVMTNAHVVGGVEEPTVQVGGEGRVYEGEVVLYDWERDIAVIEVPQLRAPALKFANADAGTGDDAIVAGFPENGGFDVRAARVRDRIQAGGPDIYRRGTVSRDIYSLYTLVRQGNSGGPLLTPRGEVSGVIFAKSLDNDDTGYALTVDEVRADVQRGRTATREVDTEECAM